jgi:hypothetical protein
MPDSREQPSVLANSGLALIVAVAAGAFVAQQVPWKGARPTEAAARVSRYAALEDVDARQWQDPLGAVARGIEERHRRGESGSNADARRAGERTAEGRHGIERFASTVCRSNDPAAIVIGAMVPGGPYPDYAENRRRARYAVLAALSEAGFVPDDPEHIGYFRPLDPAAQPQPGASRRLAAEMRPQGTQEQLPGFIPYEWLSRDESSVRARGTAAARATTGPGPEKPPFGEYVPARWPSAPPATETSGQAAPRVLVFWLDSNFFAKGIASKIRALQDQLSASCPGWPSRIAVLGPGESALLSDLVAGSGMRDPDAARGAGRPESEGSTDAIRFYDYASSVDTDRIVDPVGRAPGPGFARGERFVVLRTMGTDSAISKTLYRELLRREAVARFPAETGTAGHEASAPRHVVLISERDTSYGRNLPGELMRELTRCRAAAPACSPDEIERWAGWIHRFTYLRGLDGQQPEYQAAPEGHESRDAGSAPAGATVDEHPIEQAAGQAQLDYLRRVAEQLMALQEDLQQRDPPQSIGAIGLLGSDVYDKLLLLQALKPLFPSATFFTTELDARLLHPQQLRWTRGLIVASSFGLALSRELQGTIPPFRDSYQTSLYFATRVAIENEKNARCCLIDQASLDRWLEAPRLFEIGRHVAFDFSPPAAPAPAGIEPGAPRCDLDAGCASIHPEPSPMVPPVSASSLRLAFATLVGGALLLAGATGRAQRALGWIQGGAALHRGRRIAVVTVVGLLLACTWLSLPGLWAVLGRTLTQGGEGTPITMFEGVSLWPSELIRLVALGLAVWFLARSWRSLDRNADETAVKLRWEVERKQLIADVHRLCEDWPWWKRLLRAFSFRLDESLPEVNDPATGLSPAATRFWTTYVYQGRTWARLLRVAAATLLYMGFAVLMGMWLGFPQDAHRGAFARVFNGGLTAVAVLAMLALIFFVVDATALCIQLIGALRRDFPRPGPAGREDDGRSGVESRWPRRTVEHYASQLRVDRPLVDRWIEMRLIDRRTRAVARLVYYPFIVLSLMLLARSSVFDNWTLARPLLIALGGGFAIVIACAVLLRRAAEVSRRKAVWRLNNEIISLRGQGEGGAAKAEQVQAMVEQIRQLRSGAFAPYSEQPLVRAVLLPLTSFGGVQLMEYLTLWNI